MKFLIGCAFLISLIGMAQACQAAIERFKKMTVECKKELDIPNDIVAMSLASQDEAIQGKHRCYVECAFKKVGFIKDNKLSKDGLVNFVAEKPEYKPKMVAVYEKCKHAIPESDSQEQCMAGPSVHVCLLMNENAFQEVFKHL